MKSRKTLLLSAIFILMSLILVTFSLSCGTSDTQTTDPTGTVTPTLSATPTTNPSATPSPAVSMLPPMSEHAFLYEDYNADGTLKSNPVIYDSTETVDSVTYVKKKLTSNEKITYNSTDYTVYISVPEDMTINHAYNNPAGYFDQNQITTYNIPVTIPSPKINEGKPTTLTAGTSRIDKTAVLIASNKEGSEYYIPNLPSSKDSLHDGLTEHVVWTVDAYKDLTTFSYDSWHLIQYGWSFDPRLVQNNIYWNNLAADGGTLIGSPHTLQVETKRNNLLDVMMAAYPWNKIKGLKNADYPWPELVYSEWLAGGAIVPYQPFPGFQKNLLRQYTPWGTWTILNNTTGLYVRSEGDVEIPIVTGRTGEVQPFPLVVQTWDGNQRFTILNNTSDAIPSTTDSYPGDEVYYLGNTYLPGEAGPIQTATFYAVNDNVGKGHNRASDNWLGYRGDKAQDVMAWNTGPNMEDWGGQGRKPYMANAAKWHRTIGSTDVWYHVVYENSNSFMVIRPPLSETTGKMYKASVYVDPQTGTYEPVCSIWWEFEDGWKASIDATEQKWTKLDDGFGSWVPHSSWDINISNFPPGWVDNGDGTVAGPNGVNLALTCNQAQWSNNAIDWSTKAAYDSTNAQDGSVYKFTFSGDFLEEPSGDKKIKFLIVMNPVP